MVWCGGCYLKHPKDDFPKSGKLSGGDWKGELEGIYEKGRTGYQTLTNFQCDLCHFKNMKGRYLTDTRQEDERLMIAIRLESLDEFWSR